MYIVQSRYTLHSSNAQFTCMILHIYKNDLHSTLHCRSVDVQTVQCALHHDFRQYVTTSSFSGSFTLNVGLLHEQAAVVALIRNIDIVIAYIFDVAIFQHSFTSTSLLGSGIVVMATVGSGVLTILKDSMNDNYEVTA